MPIHALDAIMEAEFYPSFTQSPSGQYILALLFPIFSLLGRAKRVGKGKTGVN